MRTYFPTRNDIGVRDLRKSVTLGAYYVPSRGTGAMLPRATNNPVNLGNIIIEAGGYTPLVSTPASLLADPTDPTQSAISAQQSPTPQVSVPASSQPQIIYVSSGGGVPAPATTPVTTTPTTSVTDEVAGWLGGSTAIGSYSIPNALLAGAVVLGFALLSSGGSKRR